MKKVLVLLFAPLVALGLLAAAPAQAEETEYKNRGQCVRDSEKPDGKGGRSEAAKACREAMPSPEPEPETIDCTDAEKGGDGNVVVNSETDEVTISGGGEGTPGSSLECNPDDFEVVAGDKIVFTYERGENTPACGGGVPRIFVILEGTEYNTINGDPECTQADGSTITYELPASGTVSWIGIVYDRGDFGSITYSDISIADMAVDL